MTVAEQERRRTWVEMVMGLPVSVLVRGPAAVDPATERAVAELFAELRVVDDVFSTYKPASEVSRIRAGALAAADASAVVQEVLALCDQASRDTAGAFDAFLPSPDGQRRFDPSGLVKGWAVERASAALHPLRGSDWLVNAGGDVIGNSSPNSPWQVAVEDPRDRSNVLAVLPLVAGAVATSGTSARGAHLTDPRTGQPASGELLSATVTGPSLTTADVQATALFVDGIRGLARIAELTGYEALVVRPDGAMLGTPGMRDLLAHQV